MCSNEALLGPHAGLRSSPADAHRHIHEETEEEPVKDPGASPHPDPRAPSGRLWNHSLPAHTGALSRCDLYVHTQMFGWRQAAANQGQPPHHHYSESRLPENL